MKSWQRLGVSVLVCGVALAIGACDTPCKRLAATICGCERNLTDKQSCMQEVEAAAQVEDITDDELEACAKINEAGTCTCEALAQGDLKACGLAK